MIVVTIFTAFVMLVMGLWHLRRGWAMHAAVTRIESRLMGDSRPTAERATPVSMLARALERCGRLVLGSSHASASMSRILTQAGMAERGLFYRLVAVRFLLALALMGIGVLLAVSGAVTSPILSMAPFFIAGAVYFGMKPILIMLAARRRAEILRELPFLLDLLVLILRSGASLDQAFRQIARMDHRAMPHIIPVTAIMVADVDGGMGYEAAFQKWGEKLGADTVQDLPGIFTQCLVSGAEISRRLKQLSALYVERRLLSARETAGRRLTHLTVATMVFFIPPLIMLLAAPVMNSTIRALKVFTHG